MKKLYFFALICFAIVRLSFAQTPEFSLTLDINMQYVVDALPLSSGNFIVVANNDYYGFGMSCIRSDGDILWSKNINGKLSENARLSQKSDGNILIPMGYYNPHLLEINQLGDSIRSYTYTENKYSYFGAAIELPDSKIIVTENIHNNDPFWHSVIGSRFLKLSPEMNLLETYPEQPFDYRDMIPLTDSTMVTMTFAFNYTPHSIILQYSHEFQQLSGATCPEHDPDLKKLLRLNENSLVAIGRDNNPSGDEAVLTKVSKEGELIFCNTYPGWGFNSITKDESSETMYALSYLDGQYHVYTINYSGNLLSTHPLADSLEAKTIYYSDNYFYIAAGFGTYKYPRSCFIKMHRDSVLSIDDVQNLSVFNVYPNPANNYVGFEFKNQKPEFEVNGKQNEILITNFVGQEVARLAITSERIAWDCGDVKPGIYFYSYKLSGNSFSGKVVITK